MTLTLLTALWMMAGSSSPADAAVNRRVGGDLQQLLVAQDAQDFDSI